MTMIGRAIVVMIVLTLLYVLARVLTTTVPVP